MANSNQKSSLSKIWFFVGGAVIIILLLLGYKVSEVSISIFGIKLVPPQPPSINSSCPYAGVDDLQTFVNLIHAEETAVLTKNIHIISEIYASNAINVDVLTNKINTDIVEAYQESFEGFTFLELEHYDFNLLKQTSDTAWFSVADRSKIKNLSTGEINAYDHGTAHIIFRKDNSGCWKISEFRFNVQDEVFP